MCLAIFGGLALLNDDSHMTVDVSPVPVVKYCTLCDGYVNFEFVTLFQVIDV